MFIWRKRTVIISHAQKDDIAPYDEAKIFMEKLLLKALVNDRAGNSMAVLRTFVAHHGNHHLIALQLQLADANTPAYLELERYLQLTTQWIESIVQGVPHQPSSLTEQYQTLMGLNVNSAIKKRVEAYQYVHQADSALAAAPSTEELLFINDYRALLSKVI